MARRQDGDYEVPVIAEAAVGGESATNRAPRILNVSLDDIDLNNVQRDWEQQLDALLAQWFTVTRDQRNDILDQVKTAVDRNDVRALARLIASIEDAIEALTDAMSAMALTAAQEMVDEAAAQGVRIDPVATDRAPLADIAAAVAALLAEGLTNAAGREALRHYATGASGEDVARSVREHLESLSDSFIRDNLGGALSKAQLVGRMETALAGPEAAMYSSEILDKRICLAPSALVTTGRGEVRADAVRGSDELLTHSGRWVQPSRIIVTSVDQDIVMVGLEQRQLRITQDHPVLVVDAGSLAWREAGQLAVGDLVVGQASLQDGRKLVVPDLDLGKAPHDVPAGAELGVLSSIHVRAQRVPVAAVGLDDEGVSDEEVHHPASDGRLGGESHPGGLQLESDGALDAGLQPAGHVAACRAVSATLDAGRHDTEVRSTLLAGDHGRRPAAGLGAVGPDVRPAMVEQCPAPSASDIKAAGVARARARAVVVPEGIGDGDREGRGAVGTDLLNPLGLRPDLGAQVRVSEFAGHRAVDRARAVLAGDLVGADLAESRLGLQSPTLRSGIGPAPGSPCNSGAAVDTYSVHNLSVVQVTSVDREPYRGPVYDFTIPGDETFWAEGVLVHNCSECRKVHHKWLGNSSDMAQVWALYPGGQYVHCLGGIRCRGQVICVYRPEQVPGATPPVPQSSVESGAPTELGG